MDHSAVTLSFLFFYISAHAANNKSLIYAAEHLGPLTPSVWSSLFSVSTAWARGGGALVALRRF